MSKRSTNNNILILKKLIRQFAILELKYKFAQEDGRKLDCERLAKKAEGIELRVKHLKEAIQHQSRMAAIQHQTMKDDIKKNQKKEKEN